MRCRSISNDFNVYENVVLTSDARAYIGLLAPSACFFTAALLSSLGGKILDQMIPMVTRNYYAVIYTMSFCSGIKGIVKESHNSPMCLCYKEYRRLHAQHHFEPHPQCVNV